MGLVNCFDKVFDILAIRVARFDGPTDGDDVDITSDGPGNGLIRKELMISIIFATLRLKLSDLPRLPT